MAVLEPARHDAGRPRRAFDPDPELRARLLFPHADTPAAIDVVLVNGDPDPERPDLPPYGAGEAVCKPMIAAVANAIYDATEARLRRVPFRDERVLAELEAAGV